MKGMQTILAMGDSNTFGAGVERSESYPSQLENKLKSNGFNIDVINSGINGNTTKDGDQRLHNEFAQYQPHVVILLFGVADLRKGYKIRDIYNHFSSMIELCRTNEANVILVGYKKPHIAEHKEALYQMANRGKVSLSDEFFDLYSRLSQNHQIDIVTDFLDGVLGIEGAIQDDEYSHLTSKGYKIFVDKLYPVVVDVLKRSRRNEDFGAKI